MTATGALVAPARRAVAEWRLAAWLAVPAVLASLVPAAPLALLLLRGLPPERLDALLVRLDATAGLDLVMRHLPRHQLGLAVAGAVGVVGFVLAMHLLAGAAAYSLARDDGPVRAGALLGALGERGFLLLRLGLVALVPWAGVALLARSSGRWAGSAIDAATSELTAVAYRRWQLAALLLAALLARALVGATVSVLATQPARRSVVKALLRAIVLCATRRKVLAVHVGWDAAVLAAVALAALPRWALPQDAWGFVIAGLVVAQLPAAVRGAGTVARLSASLAAVRAALSATPTASTPTGAAE